LRERLKAWLAGWLGITRLNHAVSYLLMRDLSLLSAASKGPAGHAALRKAFLHLVTVLRPDVVCDIGAFDGATSLAVKELATGCEVHAFEANPETHSRCVADMTARGIPYRNLAVSDMEGRTTIHAPQGKHAGKTSLLLRNGETAYDSFEVETRTLDALFTDRLSPKGPSFFLWIDVEGAAERILAGAPNVLRQTLAVFIECETYPFWQEGGSAGRIAETLMQAGFVPVARDREYGDKQFNVLFVAGRVAHLLAPSLLDANSPLRACLVTPSLSQNEVKHQGMNAA